MTKFDRMIIMGMFKLLMQALLWLLRPDLLTAGQRAVLKQDYEDFLNLPGVEGWGEGQ